MRGEGEEHGQADRLAGSDGHSIAGEANLDGLIGRLDLSRLCAGVGAELGLGRPPAERQGQQSKQEHQGGSDLCLPSHGSFL